MTLQSLSQQYQHIAQVLNTRWPIADKQQRIFARTMKVVEELGELADEILTSMNLQRDSKIAKFSRQHVEDEFADVMGSLVLLAQELEIDLDTVMQRKIEFTKERFGMNEKE